MLASAKIHHKGTEKRIKVFSLYNLCLCGEFISLVHDTMVVEIGVDCAGEKY
jgi:uncharacterized protein (DUF169 family)